MALETAQREKDELQAAVKRMREEMVAQQTEADERNERARMNARGLSNNSISNSNGNSNSTGRDEELDGAGNPICLSSNEDSSPIVNPTLKPSRSLFNMFEDEASGSPSRAEAAPTLPRTLSKVLSHDIGVIQEGAEEEDELDGKNLFGIDSDDESVLSKGSRGSLGRSTGSMPGTGDKDKAKEAKAVAAAKKKQVVDPFEDLPAPHAAAASGDLSRLNMLGRLEVSLLSSLDAAQRCPLFYAVAYGQVEATKYV